MQQLGSSLGAVSRTSRLAVAVAACGHRGGVGEGVLLWFRDSPTVLGPFDRFLEQREKKTKTVSYTVRVWLEAAEAWRHSHGSAEGAAGAAEEGVWGKG